MNQVTRAAVLAAAVLALAGCAATGAKHRPIVDGSDPQKYEADLAAVRPWSSAATSTRCAAAAAIGGPSARGDGRRRHRRRGPSGSTARRPGARAQASVITDGGRDTGVGPGFE